MEQIPFIPEKAFLALLVVFTIMGCTQTIPEMPEISLEGVPVPESCLLLETSELGDFEYRGTAPLQASYECDLTVEQVNSFYDSIQGFEKVKSVRTEYLMALVFSRDVHGFKEIIGVTYTIFSDKSALVVVRGYSERVLDTGWV